MKKSQIVEFLKKYDFSFFGAVSAIFLIGVLNLYSATHASGGDEGLFKMQIIWFFISLGFGVAISFIQPQNYYRYAYLFYYLAIILLILVIVFGKRGMGAQRWLAFGPIRFQPSEFVKVTIALVLAKWFTKNRPDGELGFKDIVMPFLITIVPTALVVVQPDLGTGILMFLIFATVVFFRNLRWKIIVIMIATAGILGVATYDFALKEYQKKRITTFIDPFTDAKGSGYNAIQSRIAIGSGKFWGKGYKKSSQASLNYLPENHTDFAFAIFNEEQGFFGSVVLITLYLILLYRFIWLITSAGKIFNSVLAVGLMSIFLWHTFINMAMVMGLLPIVGVPLPFVSYGGSSLLTFMTCCGIATSISNSRNFF